MDYVTLGSTGMEVSRICLGCWAFGLDSSKKEEWSLGEDKSKELIERAIDLGITFFDTANSYSWGDSERVLGRTLSNYERDDKVIASKVYFPSVEDARPNSGGLSRKTIDQELTASLERLSLDTLDLYQIHRWDYDTPITTTLRALTKHVRSGQVRYIGASSMWAHQFHEALHTSRDHGLEQFMTMQNHYNLVYREEEREMLPLCEKKNIGVIPWSPLAQGYLTKPHTDLDRTVRGQSVLERHPEYHSDAGAEINERVQQIANDLGASMAQIALAWQLHKDPIDAPIIGATKLSHLDKAVEALEISLSGSDIEFLEEPYEPKHVSGHF